MKRHKLLLLIFINLILMLIVHGASAQWLTGYSNRIALTIPGENIGDGVAPHVPVEGITFLINLTDKTGFRNPNLAHTTNGGNVNHLEGYDIVFAEPDGSVLPYSVIRYDNSTGDYVAWVKLDLVENQDKLLYLYYGNPAVVDASTANSPWGQEYLGVWHLDAAYEAIEGNPTHFSGGLENILDDSGKGNHGLNDGFLDIGGAQLATLAPGGQVNESLEFDPSVLSDAVIIDPLDVTNDLPRNQMTISAWIWPNSAGAGNDGILGNEDDDIANGNMAGSDGRIISKAENGTAVNEHVWMLNVQDGRLRARIRTDNNGVIELHATNGQSNLVANQWNYVAFVYDGVDMKLYEKGLEITSLAQNGDISIVEDAHVAIGHQPVKQNNPGEWITTKDDYRFDGRIDEVRVAQEVRPDEWLITEFNNLNDQGGSLDTPGGEELCNAVPGSAIPNYMTVPAFGTANLSLNGYAGVGTLSYQWQVSYNGSDYSDLAGETANTLAATGIVSTRWYRVLTTDDNCTIASAAAKVEVEAAFPEGCYQYRKKITISPEITTGSEVLLDFPFYLEVTDYDLSGIAGKVLSPEAHDVTLTAADGVTRLDFERVAYDREAGTYKAWVKIPTIDPAAINEFYLYYGNLSQADLSGSAVWANGYAGVWHFDENIKNSTAMAGLNGLNHGTTNDAGKVGSAQRFGGDDYITIADHADLQFTAADDYTVSFWLHQDEKPGSEMAIISKSYEGGAGNYYGFWNSNTNKWDFRKNGPDNYNARIQNWIHIAAVQHGGGIKEIYVDGEPWATTGLSSDGTAMGDLVLGAAELAVNNYGQFFTGSLDEVMIQRRACTADWIALAFANQDAPASAYDLGIEESNQAVMGGTAVADKISIQSGESTNIRLSGQSAGTIRWQKSEDNIFYEDILAQTGDVLNTGPLATTTYFRALIDIGGICNEVTSRLAVVDVGGPFLPCFRYRKKITVDASIISGTEIFNNFPFLFKITDPDLAMHAGKVQNSEGFDIAFTAEDSTELAFQMESYDPVTGTYVAWVNLPEVSAANPPKFYMNYGNPSVAVDMSTALTWSGDYEAIWHLGETLNDETGNGFDGSNVGTVEDFSGLIHASRVLDGAGNYVDISTGSELKDIAGGTAMLTFWVKTTASGNNDPALAPGIMGLNGGGTNDDLFLGYVDASGHVGIQAGTGNAAKSNAPINDGQWHYIAVSRDHVSGDAQVFIDGVLHQTENTGTGLKTGSFYSIGRVDGTGSFYQGNLDELRILNTFRSADWLMTEFLNQSDQENSYTVSEEFSNYGISAFGGYANAAQDFLMAGEKTSVEVMDYNGVLQWEYSIDNETFIEIADATTPTLTDIPVNSSVGTYYFRAKVINEGCEDYSTVEAITVSAPFSEDYAYRKLVRVMPPAACSNETLYNFPVLVQLDNDPDLQHFGDEAIDKVYQADGSDIAFTQGDGLTLLPFELENYDPLAGSITAWVRVAEYNPLDPPAFYMYYGSECETDEPSVAVWHNGYETVWHLNQTADANATTYEFEDATGLLSNATSFGNAAPSTVDGKMGDGLELNPANEANAQYLQANIDHLPAITEDFTMSAWVKISQVNGEEVIVAKTNGANDDDYKYFMGIDNSYKLVLKVTTSINHVKASSPTTMSAGSWYYVAMVYDGVRLKGYINDNEVIDMPLSGTVLHDGDDQLLVGKTWDGNYFNGVLDEIRIASLARSSDWMCQTYFTQAAPVTFADFVPEESNFTWKGGMLGAEQLWSEGGNWSGCRLPKTGCNVTIPDVTYHPILDLDASVGDITLEPAASLALNGYNFTISGDALMDGTLIPGNSTVVFAGTETQYLQGTVPVSLHNMINSNPSDLMMENQLSVDNTLNFSMGKIVAGDFDLTVGQGGVSGASADKFVVTNGLGGLMQKGLGLGERLGNILFPVGSDPSSYTPVSLDNSTGTSDDFKVSVCGNVSLDGICGGAMPITEFGVGKMWSVEEATLGGSALDMTFWWNQADELPNFVRDHLFLARHSEETTWDNYPADDLNGTDPYSATTFGLDGGGTFAFGSDFSLLPVKLVSFEATGLEEEVEIEWVTILEEGGEAYTVERSTDGEHFQEIHTMTAIGQQGDRQEYHYFDEEPVAGTGYYRLKTINADGEVSYSGIETVLMENLLDIAIYPNPTAEILNIDLLAFQQDAVIELIDALGRTRQLLQVSLEDSPRVKLSLNQMETGLYIVRISTSDKTYVRKVVKK